jgi:hypothetical protein
MIGGSRRTVLHLNSGRLLAADSSGPTGPSDPGSEKNEENGPDSCSGSRTAHENGPTPTAQNPRETLPLGPEGPVGPSSATRSAPPASEFGRGENTGTELDIV